ncbi:MAG: FAD-binding oxidoreductase [Anaerovoracaceae bacterium]|jgi:FAD/FMN-containing dehydrogenase
MLSTQGLTGHVVLPSSPEYDKARQNYNGRFNKFPSIIVYCEVTEDVVNAIRWVRQNRFPFRVRSGRHSYEAYSLMNDGLIIDVSRLQKLQIDKVSNTVQIGAGLQLSLLYEALWSQGVTIPAGTCPTVAASGLTLGGGYGFLSRLLGMTCDNLLELEMVTAQGEVIHVNNNQHSDLFWACQGGGDGSFGVVTSFTFRVHQIENVSRYRMTWSFDQLKNVVRHFQMWAPYIDARLTSSLVLPAENQGDLRSDGVFVGTENELRQIVAPLSEATQPKSVEFYNNTWIETVHHFAGTPVDQEKFKNSSAFIYETLSESALNVLVENLRLAPGYANLISLSALGGRVSEIPSDGTAFVHRQALILVQYLSYWSQNIEEDENIQWIERFRNSMLPYTHGAYRNYCDSLITDWPLAYFGENISRLMKVKKIYDPENLFYFPQSIPIYHPIY